MQCLLSITELFSWSECRSILSWFSLLHLQVFVCARHSTKIIHKSPQKLVWNNCFCSNCFVHHKKEKLKGSDKLPIQKLVIKYFVCNIGNHCCNIENELHVFAEHTAICLNYLNLWNQISWLVFIFFIIIFIRGPHIAKELWFSAWFFPSRSRSGPETLSLHWCS